VSESQDLREFIREQSLIERRRADQVMEELRVYRQAMHRHFDEQARRTDELRRKTDDMIAENRTQREALFRIYDRLGNGGGSAPAT
jgi:hypothetical protein